MNSPTLYLDFLILFSAAYPSGFSYSLLSIFRPAATRTVSTLFLGVLVLPYAAVVITVCAFRPELLSFQAPRFAMMAIAALLAPVMLLIEFGLHALMLYHTGRGIPRRITMPEFWQARLGARDYLLLAMIVVGEELLYRQIWLSTLQNSLGLPMLLAIGIGSFAYGLNHLAFGWTSVASKTLTGVLYSGIYFLGGSIWLPILTHLLQNLTLFLLAKKKDVQGE